MLRERAIMIAAAALCGGCAGEAFESREDITMTRASEDALAGELETRDGIRLSFQVLVGEAGIAEARIDAAQDPVLELAPLGDGSFAIRVGGAPLDDAGRDAAVRDEILSVLASDTWAAAVRLVALLEEVDGADPALVGFLGGAIDLAGRLAEEAPELGELEYGSCWYSSYSYMYTYCMDWYQARSVAYNRCRSWGWCNLASISGHTVPYRRREICGSENLDYAWGITCVSCPGCSY